MRLSRRRKCKQQLPSREQRRCALVLMASMFAWSFLCQRISRSLLDPSPWSHPSKDDVTFVPGIRRASSEPAPPSGGVPDNRAGEEPDDELDDEDRMDHEEDIDHTEPLHFWRNFPWNDVNLSVKGSCGVDKCYWPSVSSETYGYLITAEGNYDGIVRAFSLAERLRADCGIRHLYDATQPPALVNVTLSTMQLLNRKTHNPSRTSVGEKSPYVFYLGDRCVTVIKVVVAPRDHLLYGTYGTKWDAMLNEMGSFRKRLRVPFDDFRRHLRRERQSLKCALLRAPMYYRDFQGLIDTSGRFYHIDVDGHFHAQQVSPEIEKAYIRKTLDDYDEMVGEFDNLEESRHAFVE